MGLLFDFGMMCGVRCAEEPLKMAYPELYRIACVKDALVADFVQVQGNAVHWEVTFTRLA